MANGGGYVEQGQPTALWPVGHPLLLSLMHRLVGPRVAGPVLVNLLAGLGTLGLILWFGDRVLENRLAGRLAALLYAVYPAHIVYVGTSWSEPAAAAIGMAGLALVVAARGRWSWLLGAGMVFGLAALMRTQMLLFPVGALIGVAWVFRLGWRRLLIGALALGVGMAAIVVPWSIRNAMTMGTASLSTNGGIGLITGANDRATGDHMLLEEPALMAATGVPAGERVARQVEVDRTLKAAALRWIAGHPLAYLSLGVKKVALVWRKDTDAFWSLENSYPGAARTIRIAQIVNQLYYLVLLVLALPAFWIGARAVVTGRGPHRPLALLLLMPVFVSLTAFVFTGQVRYHHPAMPFVVLAAGWTLVRLLARARPASRLPRSRPAPT